MAYIFDLPQTIGVDSGDSHDGALLGQFTKQDYNGITFYSQYHDFQYAVLQGFLTDPSEQNWIPIEDNLNAATSQDLFTPGTDPNYNYISLYISYRDGIDGYRFNCTTAATGTFTFVVEYNSPSGYITLPGATLSTDFLTTTGDSTLTLGTIPTLWPEDYIGLPSIPRQRWIRIRVATGTVTAPATVTGAWAKSAEPESDITPLAPNPPYYNPYAGRLVTEGDILYLSSEFKPGLMYFSYQNPLISVDYPQLAFKYSKADGTFGDLDIVIELSSQWSNENSHTVDASILSATGVNATVTTVQGLTGNGYIDAVAAATPTGTTDRWIVGLSDTTTGTIKYALHMTYVSGQAAYQIYIDGLLVLTSPTDWGWYDDVEVLRYNGEVYFRTGGKTLATTVSANETSLLYGRVIGIDDLVIINDVNLVDWASSRYAKPITVTWDNNTDFDVTPNSITANYPASYSFAFTTPTDFASLSAELSKTGVAGYNIGIVNLTTPTQNPELLIENYVGCDDPSNNLFKTGTQTIINFSNLVTQNTGEEAFVSPQFRGAFTYIIQNTAGAFSKVVEFTTSSIDPSPINTQAMLPKIGVTDIGIIQVGYQATDQDVGNPSEISIST
jgi:hypothetical protein